MLLEKENKKQLDKRISNLDVSGKIIFCLDFDELATKIHLTREVLQKLSKPVDKKLLHEKGSCSFNGIKYLNSLIYGANYSDYKKIRDATSKKAKWNRGFNNFFKKIIKDYSVIFISSGMKDICESKLNELGFNSRNIIAGEFDISNNKITGSNLVISNKLKGYVVNKLSTKFKIVAIGHSLGDKEMLSSADVGISINSSVKNLSKYNVNSFEEAFSIISGYIKSPEN